MAPGKIIAKTNGNWNIAKKRKQTTNNEQSGKSHFRKRWRLNLKIKDRITRIKNWWQFRKAKLNTRSRRQGKREWWILTYWKFGYWESAKDSELEENWQKSQCEIVCW